jgi:hypothetical protein
VRRGLQCCANAGEKTHPGRSKNPLLKRPEGPPREGGPFRLLPKVSTCAGMVRNGVKLHLLPMPPHGAGSGSCVVWPL